MRLLQNSRTVQLSERRFALDCFMFPVQQAEPGEPWRDIQPRLVYKGSGQWGPLDTPYGFRVDGRGNRVVYPDCDEPHRITFSAMPLFHQMRKYIVGDRVVMMADWGMVVYRLYTASIGLEIFFLKAPPVEELVFDLDVQGLELADVLRGLVGVHHPRLIEKQTGQVRLLKWTCQQGQLRVGLDFSGLRFPLLYKNTTVDLQVGASLADGHEREATGTISAVGGDVKQQAHATDRRFTCYRFTGSLFSQIATIDVATLDLYATDTNNDDFKVNFHFEDGASPAAIVEAAYNISNRTRTTAATLYDQVGVGVGWLSATAGVVNVQPPCQEIADDYSPTALAIIGWPTQDVTRNAWVRSWDGDPTEAAKLHIEYTPASTPVGGTMGAKAMAAGIL